MNSELNERISGTMIGLYGEIFEGPKEGMTWILDDSPDAAWFGAVDRISVEEARRPAFPGGATIAGLVKHVTFSLDFGSAWFRGEKPDGDWNSSWQPGEIGEQEWEEMKRDLRRAYDGMISGIQAQKEWEDDNFRTGTLGMACHSAYHLGALKQMIKAVRG